MNKKNLVIVQTQNGPGAGARTEHSFRMGRTNLRFTYAFSEKYPNFLTGPAHEKS